MFVSLTGLRRWSEKDGGIYGPQHEYVACCVSLSLSLTMFRKECRFSVVDTCMYMVNFILLQFNMFASLFLRRMERVSEWVSGRSCFLLLPFQLMTMLT